ncbi:MAG: DUF3298 and DUF4163 domain-containing protein [Clostridiales bacterium]|nr:DUF3298 and DUF4163 domain-containing protein [Clostridiales bacterium]
MSDNRITVYDMVLQQDMYYKGVVILSYTVRYPLFISYRHQITLDKLNQYYKTEAYMYVKSNIMKLYKTAMVEYEYAIKNNFPVRTFDAIKVFEVTYNKDCVLSLYFDRYEYTGGAHGITTRTSDSWNIATGNPIRIYELFKMTEDVNEFVTDVIVEQIDQEAKLGEEVFPYFENYSALVKENFNPKSFYLEDRGVIIYFQTYEIAPYSSGIREFLLPYGIGGAIRPRYC